MGITGVSEPALNAVGVAQYSAVSVVAASGVGYKSITLSGLTEKNSGTPVSIVPYL